MNTHSFKIEMLGMVNATTEEEAMEKINIFLDHLGQIETEEAFGLSWPYANPYLLKVAE